MQITITNVNVEDKGKYRQAIVEYTTVEGKAEKKNVMSFKDKTLYATLSSAKQGETYDVTLGKNDKGYWEFTKAEKATGSATQAKSGTATASPRSTYETPEERAARQIYIIRQSSLSTAVSILSVGAKGVKVNDALATAKELENYVLGKAPQDEIEISAIPSDDFSEIV